jgi:hypothetical protein
MICTTRVLMEDHSVYTNDMIVKAHGNKYMSSVGGVHLYQDENAMLVINVNQKAIFISSPVSAAARHKQIDQMMQMQDSLESYFTVKDCEKEWGAVEKDKGYYKLSMVPLKKLSAPGVQSITYWITAEENTVKKIKVYYLKQSASGIKEYEMRITKMTVGETINPFDGTVMNVVMEGGKLRSLYRDFSFVDRRK